jgi:hypothetical protein
LRTGKRGAVDVEVHALVEEARLSAAAGTLIRHSMNLLFGGRREFRCCWTYSAATAPK